MTCAPSPIRVVWPAGRCASCTGRTRRTISSSAARSFGSSPARASASTCAGTRLAGRSTPSKRAVYSRTAAAPRSRTSSHTGRIRSSATPVSSAARGRTPASFSLVMAAAGCPRRSITESTRSVYEASPDPRGPVHMPRGPATGSHSPQPARPRPRDEGTGPQATRGSAGSLPRASTASWPAGVPGRSLPQASTPLRPVPAGIAQQLEAAGHHPGGQGPEREGPARTE